MPLTASTLVLGLLLAAGGQNPTPGTAQAAGGALFRARCADCHGDDARGGRGPDLTRLWQNTGGDQRALQIIRSGVPGSIMPASTAPDDELQAIVAYLRDISTVSADAARGDAAKGQQTFAASCAQCHRINGVGGTLGPDLSKVATAQSNQVLTRAIRSASASFSTGYEPVTLVHRDGRRTRGARKAEDAFSIQIMDTGGRLQGYLKSDLREVIREATSLMPDFPTTRLDDSALADLLAYLSRFRVADPPRGPAGRPAGDRN